MHDRSMNDKPRRSGKWFENTILGINSPEIEEQPKLAFKDVKASVKEAIYEAKKIGWDPLNPGEGHYIQKIYSVLKQLAGEIIPDVKIELWPSVGTTLDYIHGADFFIVAKRRGADKRGRFILFDLCLYKKRGKEKIVLLTEEDVYNDSNLEKILKEVVLRLKRSFT